MPSSVHMELNPNVFFLFEILFEENVSECTVLILPIAYSVNFSERSSDYLFLLTHPEAIVIQHNRKQECSSVSSILFFIRNF